MIIKISTTLTLFNGLTTDRGMNAYYYTLALFVSLSLVPALPHLVVSLSTMTFTFGQKRKQVVNTKHFDSTLFGVEKGSY